MRFLFLATAVAALAACGSGGRTPAGSNGGTVTLHIDTKGSGLVRAEGTDCRGSCGESVAAGSAMHLVAVPDGGNLFSGWSGACSGTSTTCDLAITADAGVTATFAPPPATTHKLTVTLDGNGHVTSSPPGVDCGGGTCSSEFAAGATIALTAATAAGWTFGGWSGACSGSESCAIKLDGDVQVGARFNAPPPPPANARIVVAVNGRGQVSGAGLSCGSGATACDASVPAGSSQTLTASPRAQARFMDWAGACSGSATSCTFQADGEVRVTANFEDELTTLVANDGTNQPAFAINATDLFYARTTNADGSTVWAVPKAGGTPRRVTSGFARVMVADDQFLYFADYTSIYSVPVGGGSASIIFSGANGIGQLALDQNGALYWTSNTFRAFQGGASIHRMEHRTDAILADNIQATDAIAVDGTHAWFGTFDFGNTRSGVLHRVPRGGGKVEDVLSCSDCQFTSMKADAEHVYFRTGSGLAFAVPKSIPHLVLLSAGNGGGFAAEIDVSSSVVFWNAVGFGPAPNGIFRANPDGTGFAEVDTGQDFAWFGPRVDDTAVFYYHAGAFLKRLR